MNIKSKSMQRRLPIILSFFTMALLVFFGLRKIGSWEGAPAIVGGGLILLYLGWLAIESRVAKGELKKKETRHDLGTLELYATGRFITVFTALAVLKPAAPLPLLLAGIAVFIAGVLFRLYSIRHLGRFYSHRVRLRDEHVIIDTGPYRLIRHPAYTGMLVAHMGFITVFFNWLSLIVFLGLFIPAVILRILVEERTLNQLSGYSQYSRGRKRLIPAVW